MAIGPATQGADTPLGSLLLAVFNSILEVFLLCAGGYILARNGILDKKTQKQLNRLNVSLFTPALLFSKVAFFLTPEKLKELWVIPIWFVIVTVTSMLVGRVLGWSFKLRTSQRSFVMAAAMFMNSNALPIALMQSLVVSVPDLAWGPNDNKNAMLGRALTYLTMYSTLGMVVRYSYGVNLLARADTVNVPPSMTDERTPLLSAESEEPSRHASRSTMVSSSSDSESEFNTRVPRWSSKYTNWPPPSLSGLPAQRRSSQPPPQRRRSNTFFVGHPEPTRQRPPHPEPIYDSPTPSTADSDTEYADQTDLEDGLRTPDTPGRSNRQTSLARRMWRKVGQIWTAFYDFMTVPLWSALLSLIVASVEPVKHALEFHLQPLNNTINTAGKCAVPITLVVLGAYFYVPPEEGSKRPERTFVQHVKDALHVHQSETQYATGPSASTETAQPKSSSKARPGETKTIVLAVLARMIITPLLLIPLLVLATRFDWHVVFDDPVFVVVNIILLASPPALTLAQITQAVSGDAFERLISGTIFWSYCIMTPPVTICSVVLGLILAKL